MNDTKRTIRCAIYTRKSSEEGLEQEFNSLDAQYEACSAYIVSQKSEGWKRTPVRYDDGGISGGTLERPALRRLLADIEAGRVDLVVVYKIDRLTRSLMDFSKLVERFDKSNCSFVSVTQAFNTSTSMGRLTLNVLLSFAQFEREVTAERIRDKIAASKKKGMWMGGIPPIGYTAKDKELIVDPDGAKVVNRIFETYLDVKCLNRLKREIDQLGYETRPSRPGSLARAYSRGHLYNMLCNPIYIGEIRHKDQRFPGRHTGIVDREIWDRVQTLLEGRSQTVRGKGRQAPDRSPLTGRLFDETGDRLTPSYTKKKDQRIRYFVSNRLVDRSSTRTPDATGWRLPAGQLEDAIASAIADILRISKPAASVSRSIVRSRGMRGRSHTTHWTGRTQCTFSTKRRLRWSFASSTPQPTLYSTSRHALPSSTPITSRALLARQIFWRTFYGTIAVSRRRLNPMCWNPVSGSASKPILAFLRGARRTRSAHSGMVSLSM